MHFHKDKSLYEDLHTANLNKVKSIEEQLLENRWDLDITLRLLLRISF